MLHQSMDPRGDYLEHYRCADGCQKLEYINKDSTYHTVIWCTNCTTKHFQISGDINRKFVPNLSINDEISLWGNRMVLFDIICHSGHYTSRVKVNNTWLLIYDTRILRKQKLLCSSKHISILSLQTNLWKFTTKFTKWYCKSPTSQLITETAEAMIRQFVLQELVKQKVKIAIAYEEQKTDSSKVKSPVKRKLEFTVCSSKRTIER